MPRAARQLQLLALLALLAASAAPGAPVGVNLVNLLRVQLDPPEVCGALAMARLDEIEEPAAPAPAEAAKEE